MRRTRPEPARSFRGFPRNSVMIARDKGGIMDSNETLTIKGFRWFTARVLYPLKGVGPFLFIVGNLIFWMGPLFVLAWLKLFIPSSSVRALIYRMMTGIYRLAVWADDQLLWRMMGIRLEVKGLKTLQPDKLYLVLSNHQSWADIFVLQSLLNFKAPIPKFIVKKELFYMPIVGLVCWAYDYPFVKRYTTAEHRERPTRRGEDRRVLRKTLKRFHESPGSIVNFAEGTRYSSGKARLRQSPYRFLLSPKVGGIHVILQSMGDQLNDILDLTVAYDCLKCNFWQFLCGRCRRVMVEVRHISPEEAFKRARSDLKTVLPAEVADWINGIWEEKDQVLLRMRTELNRTRLSMT